MKATLDPVGRFAMRYRWILAAIMVVMIFCTGCQSKTNFGPCVGINDAKDPKLQYKISTRNAVVGIIFVETVVVPVVVVLDQFECPIGPKDKP